MAQIHVYTGAGKGKTTAALGLAFRAAGYHKTVMMVQFLKGRSEVGEYKAQKSLEPYFTIRQFGKRDFVLKSEVADDDRELAAQGIAFAKNALTKPLHVLILDEINVALDFGLVRIDEVLDLIHQAKKKADLNVLVLTGRNAPEAVIAEGDLVTEMREVKHPFHHGKQAEPGIDY